MARKRYTPEEIIQVLREVEIHTHPAFRYEKDAPEAACPSLASHNSSSGSHLPDPPLVIGGQFGQLDDH